MSTFQKTNLQNIKKVFEDRTGVALSAQKPVRRPVRTAAALAVLLACLLTATAFAADLFSSLSGDELSLRAIYEGAGVFSIQVENQSDKTLRFQPALKLMRWSTGEEIAPLSDAVVFRSTSIPAHSSGVMTIDLSAAYDIAALELPLTGDWYYLVLTNHQFFFGQDWMCTVDFAGTVTPPDHVVPPVQSDPVPVEEIAIDLDAYFEHVSFDIADRQEMDAAYIRAYTGLLEASGTSVVPSVSPVLPGNRDSGETRLTLGDPMEGMIFDPVVPAEEQSLLVGLHWASRDANFKLLATEGEYALTLSAALPLQAYPDAARELPLFYLLTYEKDAADNEDSRVFLRGQLLRFEDLAEYKVFEDEQFVCYEVSGMIYADLEAYLQDFVRQNPDLRFDEQVRARVEQIYAYYKENLGTLLQYESLSPDGT